MSPKQKNPKEKFAKPSFPQGKQKYPGSETAQSGIRVSAVAPGPVWTPLIPATAKSDQEVSTFGQQSLWGRPAQPVELSPLYVLLASDEGSYITGEIYPITGSISVI